MRLLQILLTASLLLMTVFTNTALSDAMPTYNLSVSFDIANSRITGIVSLNATASELIFHTGRLKITGVSINGERANFNILNGAIKVLPSHPGNVEIRYEGIFTGNQPRSDVIQDTISEMGISLTGLWYPKIDGLFRYNLKVTLPHGYEIISEAEQIEKIMRDKETEFTAEFPYPIDGINLIANSRYEVIKDVFNGIDIYAYFFREDAALAKTYIEHTKKYLKLYEDMLGKYPYKRFSIVENFLPTGYSMATYTLLGQDVVRLPFIVETSLGHEILHQWFGNLVYINYEKGNWAEGLTTYLSDHLYEEQKGSGWEYRKQAIVDYISYVNSKNEFPVKDFRSRTDFPSKTIGYGKTAMVFHMLKNITGEGLFYKSLRDFIEENRFRKAEWADLTRVFEKTYKKEMGWFFTQWLNGKGLLELSLENVKVRQNGIKHELSFNIIQGKQPYKIDIPVAIYYHGGAREKYSFRIDKDINSFSLSLNDMPAKIVIDEDYDLFRRLKDSEIPPVIARLIGDEKIIVVPSDAERFIYQGIIDAFKKRGAIEKQINDIKDSDIKSSSLLILSSENPAVKRLYGKVNAAESGFGISVKNNPWNPQKVVGIVSAKSKDETDAAFGKIFRYVKYSNLAFDKGRNVHKSIESSQRGISVETAKDIDVINASGLTKLQDVIVNISEKKIIYVGEAHEQFSHHYIQLQIIKGLYKKNKRIAIGMEMFQRPFQRVLDDYIAGKIEEREFLKKSEYFKRWGYDYKLYKPIVDFARSEKIPVIALNVQKEIIGKVSKGGINSLSEDEKRFIPAETDFSDDEYRERLKKIFDMHKSAGEGNFDYFYQSQVLWDETMSMSIHEFLSNNPDYQIIVIAGSGHLQYGSGIPSRLFRRNSHDYAILLNDEDIERGIADHIILTRPVEGAAAPKLMAALKEDGGHISITGFPENSISQKAGLQTGDTILSIDDFTISSIEDIKIHLVSKKTGDTIKIKVLRKRFLLGDKLLKFDIAL
ncbi:MAG: ChaN family lipoprotein [Nitrospirae bacterium]|nr:ChaN family lipoprotein [Nitrospirota bacterium]